MPTEWEARGAADIEAALAAGITPPWVCVNGVLPDGGTGFRARFVELARDLQEKILARTVSGG